MVCILQRKNEQSERLFFGRPAGQGRFDGALICRCQLLWVIWQSKNLKKITKPLRLNRIAICKIVKLRNAAIYEG